ncbi:hypothetical protein C5167_045862, partial [Papaver somniferum]
MGIFYRPIINEFYQQLEILTVATQDPNLWGNFKTANQRRKYNGFTSSLDHQFFARNVLVERPERNK